MRFLKKYHRGAINDDKVYEAVLDKQVYSDIVYEAVLDKHVYSDIISLAMGSIF